MLARPNKTLHAAGLILIYALIIGFVDNFVRLIAVEAGLWQFHLVRSVMALVILAGVSAPLHLRLRPKNVQAVLARSCIHAVAMMIYFGALAFLPVALVAAGVLTAPIFVILISAMMYGERIGVVAILAVMLGFGGAILVLGPQSMTTASPYILLPVLAGALYAFSNIATTKWCAGESAETLMAAYILMLGVFGAIGLLILWLMPFPLAGIAADFVLRGPVWPAFSFWQWTLLQAVGSLVGIGFLMRAYQIAPATKVAVFEYMFLPVSALWGWLLWEQTFTLTATLGMGLIAAAGILIATNTVKPAVAN